MVGMTILTIAWDEAGLGIKVVTYASSFSLALVAGSCTASARHLSQTTRWTGEEPRGLP